MPLHKNPNIEETSLVDKESGISIELRKTYRVRSIIEEVNRNQILLKKTFFQFVVNLVTN